MGRKKSRDPLVILSKEPKTRNQAKRKAYWTMELWLPVFKAVVYQIKRYQDDDPYWNFLAEPVIGPTYGCGTHVKAFQKTRVRPALRLQVSVFENSRVSVCVGTEEIYSTDHTYPCNTCQEDLEEAILLRFGI